MASLTLFDSMSRFGDTTVSPLLAKFGKLSHILFKADRNWLLGLGSGVAAGIEHETVLRNLTCSTVVDIGANRGQFALVARHYFPDARLYSFEPLPEPAAVYRRIFARDQRAVLHEAAVGPREETTVIHVSARDDSSSLLPLTSLQHEVFPGTAEVGTVSIRVAPLDRFLKGHDITAPALLKLDVQGYELKALEGCASLLPAFRWVYVECSFMELYEQQPFVHEIIRFLDHHEFVLSGIFNMRYDHNGRNIQADFLFQQARVDN